MSSQSGGKTLTEIKAEIRISNCSVEGIRREYNGYSESTAREVYLQALKEVYEAVTFGRKDTVVRYAELISCMNGMKNTETLKEYLDDVSNPLRETNLITLACKHDQVEILRCLLAEQNWILKCLSVDVGKDPLSTGEVDGERHGCFYYAIRSGNVKLLDTLVDWPEKNGLQWNDELDKSISRSYEELKLRKVPMSSEMEFYVENKLVELRFFSVEEDVPACNPTDDIELLIDFVLHCVRLLKEQLYVGEAKVDGKFLYVLKTMAENLHALKQLLKYTYESIPWEEMEFCLICFVSSRTERKEVNLYFRAALNAKRILYHIDNFAKCLEDFKSGDWKSVELKMRYRMPQSTREKVILGIVGKYPPLSDLYDDYWLVRDAYTLEKLKKYVGVAVRSDNKTLDGRLIITRALQVVGENLKSTLASPKLSSATEKILSLSIPSDTLEIITNIRDNLSHENGLSWDRLDASLYGKIQEDLKKISVAVVEILYRNKVKTVYSLLTRFVDSESLAIFKELADIMEGVVIDVSSSSCRRPAELNTIEELLGKLENVVKEKTDYEKQLFLKLQDILKSEGKMVKEIMTDYFVGFVALKRICDCAEDGLQIDENMFRSMKHSTNKVVQKLSQKWNRKELNEIAELCEKIACCALPRMKHDEREEFLKLICEMNQVMYFEMSNIKWIEDFGIILSRLRQRARNKSERKSSSDLNKSEHAEELQSKINALASILEKHGFGCSKKKEGIASLACLGRMEVAVEMLLLDMLSALGEKRLSNNQVFGYEYVPLLTGKRLRNHLAHGNALMDVQPFTLTWSIIGNAEKLSAEGILNDLKKIGKKVKFDPKRLREKFDEDISVIENQERMFSSLEEGKFEELERCLKSGADLRGRSLNCWSASHFAAKGTSLDIAKCVMGGIKIEAEVTLDSGQTPLHIAAAYGREDLVRYFIDERNLDVDVLDGKGNTPLHVASINGRLEMVKFLLKKKADHSKKNGRGMSALHCAVCNGRTAVAKVLLDLEENVDSNLAKGSLTTLYIAARFGNIDLVNNLLIKGADPNIKVEDGTVPLHSAALYGYSDIVKILLSNGAEVNIDGIDGCTPLGYAVVNGHNKVVDHLLEGDCNVKIADKVNYSIPLFYTAQKGYLEIARKLIKKGCDVNAVNREGISCLQLASENGYEELVQLLLSNGASVGAADKRGTTSLHRCSLNGHLGVARMLLSSGAGVNTMDSNGRSPMYLAVASGKKDLVKFLMEKCSEEKIDLESSLAHLSAQFNHKDVLEVFLNSGVPVDALNENRDTPLHAAVSKEGNISVVQYLLSKGAKVNSTNKSGFTPLHIASSLGDKCIVEALLEDLTDPKEVVNCGTVKPLALAVEANHMEIVKLLVAKGAGLDTVDERGLTALCIAAEKNCKKIAKFLVLEGADVNLGHPIFFAILEWHNKILDVLLKDKNIETNVQMSDVHLRRIIRAFGESTGQKDTVDECLANRPDRKTIIDRFCKEVNRKRLYILEESDNLSVLPLAAAYGNSYAVKTLLKKGVEADCRNGFNLTPLSLAAYTGQQRAAEWLLLNRADVNSQSCNGDTALHIAASEGHEEVVRVLLNHAADVNTVNREKRNPLEMAVAYGRIKVVRLLLRQCGTNKVDAKGNDGGTSLHIAAAKGELKMVELLLDNGADPNCVNTRGNKPIHFAARHGHRDVLTLLLDYGSSISEIGVGGWSLLHYASKNGCVGVGEYLIEAGVNVDALDYRGRTPLHVAAKGGHIEMVKCLLRRGAMYNHIDAFGRGPVELSTSREVSKLLDCTEKLFAAVKRGDSAEVNRLIREGGAVDAMDERKWSMMHHACRNGLESIVRCLLKNGANPNILGKGGCVPLHYAAEFNHSGIVKVLLANGAVYSKVSGSSKTALELTTDKDILGLLKLVDRSFISVRNGDTGFLDCLKKVKDAETAKALMKCRDGDGDSLIVAAIRNDFPKIRQLKETYVEGATERRKLAEAMLNLRNYEEAMQVLRKISEECEEKLGSDNPATLDIRCDVAKALYRSNDYLGALREFREVHSKFTSFFGPRNMDVLRSKGFIGLILHKLGKNEEAIGIFEEVSRIQEEVLGKDDPEVLDTMLHKCIVLHHLGRYEENLELNYDLLKRHERKFGFPHPKTLTVRNNLAMDLVKLERYPEALKNYEFVYEKSKSEFGLNRHLTIGSLRNMAMVLAAQGSLDKARGILEEVLDRQMSFLGDADLETLNTNFLLGKVLLKQGMYIRALKVYTGVLVKSRAILGSDHPQISESLVKIKFIKTIFKSRGEDPSQILKLLQDDIFAAANDGNSKVVDGLIKNLKDPNSVDEEGRTPMHFAVSGGHANVVSVLLNNGGDITKVTAKNNTVLHIATLKRNTEMVELLLSHARRNIADKLLDFVNAETRDSGSTALHIASKGGCYDIAKCLLEHGAAFNPEDNICHRKPSEYCEDEKLRSLLGTIDGLFSSALRGDNGIIEKLKVICRKEFLPVFNARNIEGKTAIQVAFANGHKCLAGSLIRLLKENQLSPRGLPN